jgi:hypothetical protein
MEREIIAPVWERKLLRGERIMFKKNTWVAGLLMALVIMFVGCVDPEAGPDGVETTLFDLQEVIGDLDAGYIDDWGSVFDNTPFQKCGSPDVQIIVDGGKKKLKIDNMQNGWGEGVDLYNNNDAGKKIVGVGFKAGDEIYIKGTINPVGNGLKLTNGGGKPRFGDGWISEAEFDKTVELKAADIAEIKGANPNAVRISYADPDGDARKGTIIIEELTVKGLRKAGEGAEPPLSYAIDGSGSYKVPASSGLEIFIDLNEAIHGQLTPGPLPAGFPKAKIEGPVTPATTGGKLTVPFTTNLQTIFVGFTPEVKNLIVSAAFAGYTFKVNINGSGVTNGKVRWCFGADRTGGWNLTGPLTAADFDSQKTDIVQTLNTGAAAGDIGGIVIQARNDSGGIFPWTMTINSIKIELVPPAGALTVLGTSVAISVGKPGTGRVADKSVDGTGFTGLVTWYPELPRSGRFEALKDYRAEIAIFPKAGYTTSATTNFVVNTGAIAHVYNAATRVVSTVNFGYTKAVNELALGQVFKLSDYVKAGQMGPILQNAGANCSVSDAGITVTGASADWHGLDILLKNVDAGIDPAVYKVKVVVTGKVLTMIGAPTAAAQMRIGSAGSPYTNPTGGTYENYSDTGLVVDDVFTISVNEIVDNYFTSGAGNQFSLRICNVDPPEVTSFIITEIIITNLGER